MAENSPSATRSAAAICRPGEALFAEVKQPQDLTASEIETWRQIQSQSEWLDSPFYAPEFTLAVAGSRADTKVAVLRQGQKTAGFFPFHLTPRAIARPVGGTFSDYQGPILAPRIEIPAQALLRACGLRAYDFNHCPASLSPLAESAMIKSSSPRIEFRDGYDAYFASSPARSKDALKKTDARIRKMSRELGAPEFRLDDRRPESWEWLVETKTRALNQEGVKAGFNLPWVSKLLGSLRETHSTDFSGLLSTVTCGGRMVAAHFGLRAGPVLCWWHTTYDEEYRQYAPGLVLLLMTLRGGEQQGLAVIDLGRGDQHYKLVFANSAFELCEGAIARSGTVAAALRYGHRAVAGLAESLPLGKYQSIPRRALGRLVSNVRLP